MASIRRQAFLQAKAQIETESALEDGSTKPDGLSVFTGRGRPVEDEDLPCVLLYEAPEQPEPADHGGAEPVLERVFRFRTEIRVKATRDDEDPGGPADEIYVWLVKALMEDPTLGGLVQEVEEGATVPSLEELAWPYMDLATEWVTTLYTPRSDPEVNAND